MQSTQTIRCCLLQGARATKSAVSARVQLGAPIIVQVTHVRNLQAKPPRISLKQTAPSVKPAPTIPSRQPSAKAQLQLQLQQQQQHTQPIPVQPDADHELVPKVDRDLFYPEQMEWLDERLVRISRPTKNVMQSGTAYTDCWKIEFNSEKRYEYWLMGWTSSNDPVSNLSLTFPTKDGAIAFCERNKLQWFVEEQPTRKVRRKSYADNFSWDKRTRTGNK